MDSRIPLMAAALRTVSLRLNARTPLFTMFVEPNEPLRPLLPTCNTPLLMPVVPGYVLLPASTRVPIPTLTRVPAPLKAPA